MLKKIKSSLFITFAFLIFANTTLAQKVDKDCFEIKYLDFFGLDEVNDISWSDKELDEMLKMNYYEQFDETRFFIPILVRYLKDFHPACSKSIDKVRFDNLIALYFKVTLKDISLIRNKSIEEKLSFIRNDFYNLVGDVESLPRMSFSFDDGPLYGEIPKVAPKMKLSESVSADFGKLSILESNERILLVATDKKGKTIWSRIMKGANPDRHLQNLKFDKVPMKKTSLATIFNFYSEGERLNLYLKPDGKFMYYYHSW